MKKLKAFLAGITALSCCCAGCLPIVEQITSMYSMIANAEDTEEIATSETCGKNLTWGLDEATGTLTISGTGAMTDWKYGESPWYNNKNIKEVIIKDGVTTIGDRAFWDCFALESITIPESVETIGKMTFYGCTALESITIPKRVEIIGDMAFYGCTALESVTIPDSVKVIRDGTFCYCSALESVKIPNSVTKIGDYTFGDCWVLTSITIENPDCDIYDSDYIISDDAIIYGYTNSTAQEYAEKYGIQFVSLDELPEKPTKPIITSGTCGENLTWEFDEETGTLTISGTGAMTDCYGGHTAWFDDWNEDIKKVVIEDGVTTIGEDAFSWCKSLTSITIPDSVTTIGYNAFRECTALESITIKNPECEILEDDDSENTTIPDTTTIYGYENSTSQAYAEKYERNFVSLGTAPEILTGDADKDGEFNILDVIVLQKWLLGAGNLPNWKAVDFNEDGIINIFDFMLAKKYYLENIS